MRRKPGAPAPPAALPPPPPPPATEPVGSPPAATTPPPAPLRHHPSLPPQRQHGNLPVMPQSHAQEKRVSRRRSMGLRHYRHYGKGTPFRLHAEQVHTGQTHYCSLTV